MALVQTEGYPRERGSILTTFEFHIVPIKVTRILLSNKFMGAIKYYSDVANHVYRSQLTQTASLLRNVIFNRFILPDR